MKRLLLVILVAVAMILPTGRVTAGESASIAVSVTVLPSPLIAIVEPDCQFVVTSKTTKVDCSTLITVAQPTFQFDGWQLLLSATDIVNTATGKRLEAKSIKLIAYSSFEVHWGQPVDKKGGPYIPKKSLNRSLEDSLPIIAAKPGYGIGGYTTLVHFELKVPPKAQPGTYVPNIEIEVSNTFDIDRD